MAINKQGQGLVSPKVVLKQDVPFLYELTEIDRKAFEFLSVVQTKKMWNDYKKYIHLEKNLENMGFLESKLDGAFSSQVDLYCGDYVRPMLILVGRQDTNVGFKDQYEEFCDYCRTSIIILDLAGHNLQLERQELFKASFLDRIERVQIDWELVKCRAITEPLQT